MQARVQLELLPPTKHTKPPLMLRLLLLRDERELDEREEGARCLSPAKTKTFAVEDHSRR